MFLLRLVLPNPSIKGLGPILATTQNTIYCKAQTNANADNSRDLTIEMSILRICDKQ